MNFLSIFILQLTTQEEKSHGGEWSSCLTAIPFPLVRFIVLYQVGNHEAGVSHPLLSVYGNANRFIP